MVDEGRKPEAGLEQLRVFKYPRGREGRERRGQQRELLSTITLAVTRTPPPSRSLPVSRRTCPGQGGKEADKPVASRLVPIM